MGYAPGRVPILTQAQQDALRKALEKPEGFHSYVQIQEYIAETFGVEMNYREPFMRWFMINGGRNSKGPRPSHEKNVVVSSETFRCEFGFQHVCQAISEKRSGFEKVRVFSQDETRYGPESFNCRVLDFE